MLQKKGVTSPIVGASKAEHLTDAVAALSLKLTADEIKIVYEDSGTTNGVTLKSTGNHIKVTSDKDLTRSTDLKTLSYGTPNQGHISRIEINGNATNPFCTFSAADQFDELLILDW